MASDDPVLKIESVGKEFFGNRVLADVSFSLERGEILGLVGENGAGKSTLMNILFGMPVIASTGGYEGRVIFEGAPVKFASPFDAIDAGIGMVHQEFSLLPGFTVTENILLNRESTKYNPLAEVFGDRMRTLDRADMRRRAASAIEAVGCAIDPDTPAAEMPVGHKQFTEIAREIDRSHTKLLVLDEPTAVLAESEAEILMRSLKNLSARGIAMIFISHRLQEVMDLCDKIVVLRDGRIVNETRPADTDAYRVAEMMVGRNVENAASRVRTSDEGEIAIEVERLWVDMPGETVRNATFSVRRGEIFGIGGLAGQGKLGIANGIMGLFAAGGSVKVGGAALALNNPGAALSRGMAFVSEDRRGVGLLLDEPIDWNIAFTAMQVQNKFLKIFLGGLLKWRDDEAMKAAAAEYIKMLDIKCTSHRQRAVELSGGNQQKICLAKAFAVDPGILFVSEPTRGIDVGAKKLVLDALRRVNEERGTTIIITSSELEELRAACDRIAIVDSGGISGILPASSPAAEFGLLMMGSAPSGAGNFKTKEESAYGQN